VLGQSPAGATVEVATRQNWMWVQNGATDVTIDGLTFTQSASVPRGAGIGVGSEGQANPPLRVTIRNSTFSETFGTAVQFDGGPAPVRRNTLRRIGSSLMARQRYGRGNRISNVDGRI
jgi:hypothetical protein